MAIGKDWISKAAEAIGDHAAQTCACGFIQDEVALIIRKHSPLEEGVAYMPVPRCETCEATYIEETALPMQPVLRTTRRMCSILNVEVDGSFGCVKWRLNGNNS